MEPEAEGSAQRVEPMTGPRPFDPVKAGVMKVAARKGHLGLKGQESPSPISSAITTGGLLKLMDSLPLRWDAPMEVRVSIPDRHLTMSTQLLSLHEEDGKLVISASTED